MFLFFFFNDTATTEIYTLSLHDALPIYARAAPATTLWRSFQDRMPRIMTALPIAVLPAWSGGRCRPVAGRKEPRLLYRCGDRFSRGVSETTLCLPPRQTHSRNRIPRSER